MCQTKRSFARKPEKPSAAESSRAGGGPGVGAPCTICEKPVTRAEMEFEIQFEHDGAMPGLDKFHAHIRCFAVWELERKTAQG
jgi:hypothetical protein